MLRAAEISRGLSSRCCPRSKTHVFFSSLLFDFLKLVSLLFQLLIRFLSDSPIQDMTDATLPIIVEFSGGAELLFDNEKRKELLLPLDDADKKWNLTRLIKWLQINHLKERPELFVQGDTVRPGILVLVNETDWELLGEGAYSLQPNDRVLFISTLHGG